MNNASNWNSDAAHAPRLSADPKVIFDSAAIDAKIAQAAKEDSTPANIRAKTVKLLREAQTNGRAAIAAAFADAPFDAGTMTVSYTYLTDGMVKTALRVATQYLHPTPADAAPMSVVGVGGYGRGEMAPFSDVDLLFLVPGKITPWASEIIEAMLYLLWDLKLKVGHSSRNIRECVQLAKEDYTIQTALLEHRYVCGDLTLSEQLDETLKRDLFSGSGRGFIEAKLEERDARHLKQGQRYVVEPNVKEGKGGLRDLQSLFWIAKYIHGVEHSADLVTKGMFRADEYETFQAAENFLWAVRSHLHLLSNRATEQLTFDMQVSVAEAMRYTDQSGRRGVEVFMQAYFRHATAVGDLTRIFLTKLEDMHVKSEPLLERLFRRRPRIRAGYKVVHNRISLEDETAFLSDPLNILRVYEEALRTGMLIDRDTMRVNKPN
ncbi:MAG: [protein-PII] uridylyltransferase, partial [Sulfitobacter sp.]